MKNTKCLVVIFALFGALFTISTSASGQAVQWTQAEGGNGNWYQLIATDDAFVQDLQSELELVGANLASIESEGEQVFVAALSAGIAQWTMLGAEPTSPPCDENFWQWLDGTPWNYTAWDLDATQPDCGGAEYIGTWGVDQQAPPRTAGLWHDISVDDPRVAHAVVEWSADCNGDGIVDYGQILNGELTDNDGNGVPDMCEPQQWRVEDGGNGNWYQLIATDDAFVQDLQSELELVGANLASIESEGEQVFVAALSAGIAQWTMLGAEPTSPPCDENFWQWLDGTPWNYTAWDLDATQPDCGGAEYIGTWGVDQQAPPRTAGLWHDISVDDPRVAHAVVEWSADCNGDGMVDYGQILSGELTDDDGNGVPDCCDDTSCLAPVQWKIEDGGNGNWYGVVQMSENICWEDARSYAIAQGGDLATPTTLDEDLLLKSVIQFIEPGSGTYIGGFQNLESPQYSEPLGGWEWVTGESWSYSNWHPSEPENAYGGEHYLAADFNGPVYGWFDLGGPNHPDGPCHKSALAIEWSADCNGDGMVDYGQILNGELTDNDGNGVPDVCEECPGDIIEDGVVDLVDFTSFLVNFGATGENIADLNGDLVVDLNDFSIFLVNYGNVCETRSAVAETGVGKVAPTHHIGGVPRR